MSDIGERVLALESRINKIYGGIAVAVVSLLGFFGFSTVYQIPRVLRDAVPQAVSKYIEEDEQGMIQRIKDAEGEILESAAAASANLAVIEEKAQVATGIVTNLRNSSGLLLVDSGTVRIHYSDLPELVNPVECVSGAFRGDIKKKQEFSVPFSSPPSVAIALSWLDLDKEQNTRVHVYVIDESVTEESFEYTFHTYCDSKVYGADASWIALGN